MYAAEARDVDGLAPWSHEKADTRMVLNVQDAVRQGHSIVSIGKTVDTDVIEQNTVTAAGRLDIEELRVAFGTGRKFRFLNGCGTGT